jgi:hypothetical protein
MRRIAMASLLIPSILASTRRIRVVLLVLLLAFMGALVLPARAAERGQLPFVNNFATAQFKLLSTVDLGGVTAVAFGAGELVLPDRSRTWVGTNDSSELTEVVQIGSAVYVRVGDEPWERSDDLPMGLAQAQPVSAQFNQLQQSANAILDMGAENVGDVPAKRYQVWLSGAKALEAAGEDVDALPPELRDLIENAAYKYDFWIGTQDSFLHQQLTTVILPAGSFGGIDIPETQTSVLVTFFDINNPNISVNAPI